MSRIRYAVNTEVWLDGKLVGHIREAPAGGYYYHPKRRGGGMQRPAQVFSSVEDVKKDIEGDE